MNKQEDFQNRALAHLLTEQGVAADFEQRAGRRRMDVVADVDGLRVVLEAETGFDRKAAGNQGCRRPSATAACHRCVRRLLSRRGYRGQSGRGDADLDRARQGRGASRRLVHGRCDATGTGSPAGAAFPERRRRGGTVAL